MKVDSKHLFRQLVMELTVEESQDEKEAMVFWILEHELGLSRTEVLSGRELMTNESAITGIMQRVNQGEPLQYILGEAQFYGRKFMVGRGVLIPRPETELLVKSVVDHFKDHPQNPSILDIGTGSGCIAITVSLELPQAFVHATDVSPAALEIARKNSERMHAKVQLHHHDILKNALTFGPLDVVVSNPPYILERERPALATNVVDHEPGGALFVPDNKPLQFHIAIATKARDALKRGGLLITEINERKGRDTAALFESLGYIDVNILNDLDGKNRFVSAVWP